MRVDVAFFGFDIRAELASLRAAFFVVDGEGHVEFADAIEERIALLERRLDLSRAVASTAEVR
ncbi:MAG: hypothetical protein IPG50_21790 [Myxococcales bacterium]|nr:hypothetical protein [Myxococcales bacterium]